jgi:hypothetical protein
MLCKIWGFHGGDYEECRLLGCYAVWLDGILYILPRSALQVVSLSPINTAELRQWSSSCRGDLESVYTPLERGLPACLPACLPISEGTTLLTKQQFARQPNHGATTRLISLFEAIELLDECYPWLAPSRSEPSRSEPLCARYRHTAINTLFTAQWMFSLVIQERYFAAVLYPTFTEEVACTLSEVKLTFWTVICTQSKTNGVKNGLHLITSNKRK